MPEPELARRVAATTGLTAGEAARVVDDVMAYFDETVTEYVRRRHTELQLYGTRNPEAFRLIAGEVRERPFAAPPLTERQLRRIVYG